MFHIRTAYPSRAEEEQVVPQHDGTAVPDLRPVMTIAEILRPKPSSGPCPSAMRSSGMLSASVSTDVPRNRGHPLM